MKGSRVYFMQNILHNWPDNNCHTILTQLAKAMTPGYSKLLIANIIMPEENAPLRQCGVDIVMLYFFGGAQRSQQQWTALLEPAGFKIVKFWLSTLR